MFKLLDPVIGKGRYAPPRNTATITPAITTSIILIAKLKIPRFQLFVKGGFIPICSALFILSK